MRAVLVVEDDSDVRALLEAALESAGYRVSVAADGLEGLRRLFQDPPDLVILDVLMPRMDGWTLLGRIREVSDVPVLMLTALGQESDRVRGLHGGADDYIVKPFGAAELLARVEAALRRAGETSGPQDVYRDAALEIDFRRQQVHLRGQEVHLTPQEFRLLSTLAKNPDATLDAEALRQVCWLDGKGGRDTVRVHIGNLRRKLETDPARPQLIENVRGFGYRYHPPEPSN